MSLIEPLLIFPKADCKVYAATISRRVPLVPENTQTIWEMGGSVIRYLLTPLVLITSLIETQAALTHLPRNDIPSGILSSKVTFYVQHTLFPQFATIERISFSRNRAFVRCDSENARN